MEILILLFDFSYFDVEILLHDYSYINSTAFFFFIFIFLLRISHNFNNQEQTNFDFYFNTYLSVGFYQNGKTEYNYVYVFIEYFCAIVTYCTIKYNILFPPLNLDKVSEQRTGYRIFFATGDWLKQPVYICIGQRFGWEIYFPLLS